MLSLTTLVNWYHISSTNLNAKYGTHEINHQKFGRYSVYGHILLDNVAAAVKSSVTLCCGSE
jgi:hypothetical protein